MKKLTLLTLVLLLFCGYNARSQWVCGQDITDSRDSKVYKTVLIGNQCWMAENLNYGTRINSTKQGYEMTDNGVIEKYCWNDSVDYCDGTNGKMKKGAFYEWKEAVQHYGGQPGLPVQGVCPAGWHMPTNAEWNTLLNGLGGTTAYSKMLKGGSSGFEALLTGYRCTMTGGYRKSAMNDNEFRGYYWTTEQTDADNTPFLEIAATQLISMSFYKSLGLSVRCIKNTTSSLNDESMDGLKIDRIYNAGNNVLVVDLSCDKTKKLRYNIININGQVLFSGEMETMQGINNLQLQTVNLTSGIYVLRIFDQNSSSNNKFIIN
jgi:uncharacterized protein (TIGR02145 family)